MRRAGVICEFSPFHNGHKFLLEKIKSSYADEIVCIMSGSFVQRGDIAVTDKFARTAAALQSGADLAAELPTVYAVSSAQRFAQTGVHMAHELGCEMLCFGAEDNPGLLTEAVRLLDTDEVQQKIAEGMKQGLYYPRALAEAMDDRYAEVLSRPNNILAIEYIRACAKYDIRPVAIRREGAAHHSAVPVGKIASATAIRAMIEKGEDYAAYTPMVIENVAHAERIEPAILYQLKTMRTDELALLADVSEGLENRIADAAKCYNSIVEILEHIKTKRYTMARLRRIMIYALLGITKEMQQRPVPYLRILGVKKDKKDMITSRTMPLIVDVRRGYEQLDNSAKEIFDIDLKASELMNIAADLHLNEFSQGVIIS